MKTHRLILTKPNRQRSRDGVKTMTRRVVKPQPDTSLWKPEYINKPKEWRRMVQLGPVHRGYNPNIWCLHDVGGSASAVPYTTRKPRYQVGDHLGMLEPYQMKWFAVKRGYDELVAVYLDDNVVEEANLTPAEAEKWKARKKPYARTSARFMYGSLTRTRFVVTGVGCERVQKITTEDILAEGIRKHHISDEYGVKIKGKWLWFADPRAAFKLLWNSINAKPKPVYAKKVLTHYVSYPWDDTGEYAKMKTYRGKPHYCYPNCWCWVYEYKLIRE